MPFLVAVFPLALVHVASRVSVGAASMMLAVLPFALVLGAVGPPLDAVPVRVSLVVFLAVVGGVELFAGLDDRVGNVDNVVVVELGHFVLVALASKLSRSDGGAHVCAVGKDILA
eukprot:1755130-Prymnesium_polylepis.1